MRERHRQRTVPLCSAWCPDGAVSCDAIQHYTYNSTLNIVQYAAFKIQHDSHDRIARHASGASAAAVAARNELYVDLSLCTGVIHLNCSHGWCDRIARHASGAAVVLIDSAAIATVR